jgi:hypothetical protein
MPVDLLNLTKVVDDLRVENGELLDKVDALESELAEAVHVAYNYGASNWCKLNYPEKYKGE